MLKDSAPGCSVYVRSKCDGTDMRLEQLCEEYTTMRWFEKCQEPGWGVSRCDNVYFSSFLMLESQQSRSRALGCSKKAVVGLDISLTRLSDSRRMRWQPSNKALTSSDNPWNRKILKPAVRYSGPLQNSAS